MKIGIIFCLYNCESTLNDCLNAWEQVGTNQFVYSCISTPFKGYEDFNPPVDNTVNLVRASEIMNAHFINESYLEETQARGLCLQYLKNENCDIIWMVDGDEIYTVEQIKSIIKYIENNPETTWFKLCLKNYIFDSKTYLEEPFIVPRIYRVTARPFELGTFYQDNDIDYIQTVGETKVSIPNGFIKNKTIPQKLVWVSHLTWPSNENSRLKVEYQLKRWNLCSYSWKDGKLDFNPDYYKNKQLPKILTE